MSNSAGSITESGIELVATAFSCNGDCSTEFEQGECESISPTESLLAAIDCVEL